MKKIDIELIKRDIEALTGLSAIDITEQEETIRLNTCGIMFLSDIVAICTMIANQAQLACIEFYARQIVLTKHNVKEKYLL